MADRHGSDTTFVLVHGAYHSARCWEHLSPYLNGNVTALDLYGRASSSMDLRQVTLTHWRDQIIDAVDIAVTERVVLVGHSLGGLLLPAVAASRPRRVSRIVFLSGVIPVEGGTQRANLPRLGRLAARMQTHDGILARPPRWLARAIFCNQMSRSLSDWTLDQLVPEAAGVFDEPVIRGQPTQVPAIYLRPTHDRAVSRRVAKRQIANYRQPIQPVGVAGGHDAMISHPTQIAAVLNAPF